MGSRGEARAAAGAATVQELAATGDDDVTARYVARRQHDRQPVPVAAAPAPVPVIDLGRLRGQDGDGAAAADELAKLRMALQSWGLFLVTNHGVDASVMDGMMAASREFFSQPAEEKRRSSNLVDGERFQLEGYGTV